MRLPKTTHILCAAPAGFYPSRLPRLNGAPKIKIQSHGNININGNGSATAAATATATKNKRLAFAGALGFWGPL